MNRVAVTAVLCVGLALSLPALGAAKDLTQAQVCGESGCAALPRDQNGDGLIQLRGSEGREVSSPPKTAPYYSLVWEFGPPAENGQSVRFATLYVPSAQLIAAPGMKPGSVEWFGAADSVLAKVRGAIRGLAPFPAPARWPTTIVAPADLTPTASGPAAEREWLPWALAALAVLVTIAMAFLLALRLRVDRLRPAE